jgi:RNase P subunit RPR2
MPNCKNCESFVTTQYVRVFAPPEMDTVRVCPNCEDKIREGAEVRETQFPRHSNR